MAKEFWINLPVKDINKSKQFFTALGFSFNPKHGNDESACLLIGDKPVVVMLFAEPTFNTFTRNKSSDTTQSTEVLLSFDAESREEVDAMIEKAKRAGGTIYSQPTGQGWMYGGGFADLDGHRWNVLYMDKSQMPKE